jgi:hypothetical protein
LIEELDLLSSIAGRGGQSKSRGEKRAKFEVSIITTFNAYLPFYEEVVLRRLVSSGCQYNVLLMDSGELSKGLAAPTSQPRLAGRAYTLVPMRSAGAFHPKVALLMGKNNSRVFIGSHNVTLSGFGHNREITTIIDLPKGTDDPDAHLARAVWKFLEDWLEQQTDYLPESILNAAKKVATTFSPWLREESDQSREFQFIGTQPMGDSLWDRTRPILPKKAKQIIGIGPFFDRAGAFIKTMAQDLKPVEIILGVEPDKVVLCRQDNLPPEVRFVDASSLGNGKNKRFLHAKGFWVQGDDGQMALVTGSANLSSPAWTEVPKKRNVEAVIVHLGDSALKLAENLGIMSIPSMPELGKETLVMLAKRAEQSQVDLKNSSSVFVLIAEGLEKEILLPYYGSDTNQIMVIRCWEHERDNYFSPLSFYGDHLGLHIAIKIEDLSKVSFLEVQFKNGHRVQALIHNPKTIARLNRTSKQRYFQEALESLESGSSDLPTLMRLAEKLIFDEEVTSTSTIIISQEKKKNENIEISEESLGPLSVSIQDSKEHRKKIKELRGNDLAFIIDILIYRLGLSLRNETEQLEEDGPSEEEQVGKEEDAYQPIDEIPKFDLIKTIQGKIRTLVYRMLKQFKKAATSFAPSYKPVEQLLAVLAVLREVRAQDGKLSQLTEGQSLVPFIYRRQLLDGSIAALFGHKQKLFTSFTNALGKDPDEDVSRLLGLVLWLAYDSEMDARNLQQISKWDREQREEVLFNISKLLEIGIVSGRDEAVFKEAERSIYKTIKESSRGRAIEWLKYHRIWIEEIDKLRSLEYSWEVGQPFKVGDLGIAIKEENPKPRVVTKIETDKGKTKVHFAEIGRENNIIQFISDYVVPLEMPKIISERFIL